MSEEIKATQKAEKKEKTVKIIIPRTNKDEGDVYVSVNDRTWLIKRGKEVEVPHCVASVIRHSERMKDMIFDYNEAHSTEA